MNRSGIAPPLLVAVIVAIGCGSSKPQEVLAEAPDQPQAQAPQAATGAASGSAQLTGSVKFEGQAPAPEKVKMAADPVCQQQHTEAVTSEAIVVNANGTLKNVFVYVKEGVSGSYPAPSTPVVLDQLGCWYAPHVFGIQVLQPLQITNSDGTLHNVNSKATANKPFNIAQPVKNMKTEKKFTAPEVMVSFKCNVHPWMQAWGGVVSHPFFGVSDENGAFQIAGLPQGTYTIEAWHEKYGTQTQSVTVADGESKALEFAFKAQ
jgi:hypothetical protein